MELSVTRGDTPTMRVNLVQGADGSEYSLGPGDELTFTVKKSTKVDSPVLVQKVMTEATGPLFRLDEDDTSLDYGSYVYDVQLRTAHGDVYTVMKPDRLAITAEVTTRG